MELRIILAKTVANIDHAQEIFDLVKSELSKYPDVTITGHITATIETTHALNGDQ